ncbi:MAG TPA: SDR family oxidoreductase [Dehalococcoidia bacterium]|nr:SDR family oxidoreductase [Dehalococcoidia bacterium]
MDLGIAGKIAIVAAASKGMGKAVAVGLAREGAHLAICARGESELKKTTREITSSTSARVLPVVADVTSPNDIQRLVKKTADEFGRIDILVNNAGGPPSGLFNSFSDRDWQDAVVLNLLSAVRLCREVIPYMQKAGGGRIINIVSVAAKQPIESLVLSNSIRAAVIGLAKTLSIELAPDNILVNNICPGWILTDRLSALVKKRAEASGKSFDSTLSEITTTIPLHRCGTPEEVANLIVFLASERASYITGTTIQVDGGLTKGLL